MEKSLRVRLPCGVIRNVLQRLRQLRWRGFTLLLSWATVAGGLWIFLVLTEEVLGKDTHEVEKRIMLALRNPDDLHRLIGPSWLEHAAVNLTALGSVSVLTLLVVLVAGYFLVTRQFVSAALLAIASLGGTIISHVLKQLVARDRPDVVPHLARIHDPSFPSGHSLLSTVIFLTIAVILAHSVPDRRAKVYLVFSALLLAFIVGLTRILIGVHYPSDVLAGWTIGAVWAVLCWLATDYWRARLDRA